MTTTTDTVTDRIARAGTTLTPVQTAMVIGLAAALGFALLFLQAPMAHESLHDFRHAAGVVCH
ncbi:CbtB domain-containing protein [Halegenticoccus tardaugens]|uniref:CbtB domain-containing protein n=1 Tax=Halegenticoccus tardaugens TaxID=2071624 RepID=UPI00100B4561|nr:CbtB-domain containing protein [Halegenticoccus tardaugens]